MADAGEAAAAAGGTDAVLKRKAEALDGDAAAQSAVPEPAPEPVTLGPKTFPTAEHCFRYFSGLLNAMTCHQDCNEYERLVLEPLLIRGHPAAASKVGTGVRAFQVREHPEHGSRCFFVVREDGSAEDFSYRKCAEALFPSSATDVAASALRRGVRSEGGAKRGRGSSGAAPRTSGGGATRGGSFGSGGRAARRAVQPAGEGGGAGRGGTGRGGAAGRSGGGGSRGRGARGRGRGRR